MRKLYLISDLIFATLVLKAISIINHAEIVRYLFWLPNTILISEIMDSVIAIKKPTNLKHVTTRTGIETYSDSFLVDSMNLNVATSSCGSKPGKKSCWNVVNQSYTCIPESNICCGDGHSCTSNLRCAGTNDLDDCISLDSSYYLCHPKS